MEEILYKLIEIVEKTAPELWRIALREVVVVALQHTLWIAIFAVVLTVTLMRHKEMLKKYAPRMVKSRWGDLDYLENPEWLESDLYIMIALWIASAILLFMALIALGNLLGAIINPEYRAIGVLLQMMK